MANLNELKPEDVTKALDCCERRNCGMCHYKSKCGDACVLYLCGDALALLREKDALIEALTKNNAELETELAQTHDLLEEKDAEIERLQGALKAEERHNELTMECAKKALANARAEAITEFAESVKMYFDYPENDETHALYVRSLVDQIAEEMKGETDGKSDL